MSDDNFTAWVALGFFILLFLVVAWFHNAFQGALSLVMLGGLIWATIRTAMYFDRKHGVRASLYTADPIQMSAEEIDAVFDEAVALAKSNLPHLKGYLALLRSIVKKWPPTQDMRERMRTFIFSNTSTIVHHFPKPDLSSPLQSLVRPGDILNGELIPYEPQQFVNGVLQIPVPPPPGQPTSQFVLGFLGKHEAIMLQMRHEIDKLFNMTAPIPYTDAKRFEHAVILGSPGSGKTTLLSHLLLFDLHRDDSPGIILIDPKRTVIRKLSRLALFNQKLKDRLIVISPKDHPAINIFDTTNRSSNVGAIQSIEYLCGMLGQDMTGKQAGFYRNIGNLLLHFKDGLGHHATLLDLIELTARKFPTKYEPVVKTLPPIQRRFFESGDFESPDYRDTKDQIRTRLNALLGSEGMSNLFTAQDNAINVFEELNKGSIILVDTGEGDPLDRRESASFGCIFMAEIVRAILQRTPLEDKGRPAFVYVDEAATFFVGAEVLQDFLTSGRQNKIGGIFAFHDLKQAGEGLRATITTMTSTKILSKYAVDDIAGLGRHMNLTVEEMQAMPDYHWACAIRGVADKAVTITCASDELDKEPVMSEPDYQAFLRKNREKVGGGQQQQGQQQTNPHPQPAASPPPSEPKDPPPKWTEQDELALADALHQLAIAMRRKDAKRVSELQQIIAEAMIRKQASQEHYKEEEAFRL